MGPTIVEGNGDAPIRVSCTFKKFTTLCLIGYQGLFRNDITSHIQSLTGILAMSNIRRADDNSVWTNLPYHSLKISREILRHFHLPVIIREPFKVIAHSHLTGVTKSS